MKRALIVAATGGFLNGFLIPDANMREEKAKKVNTTLIVLWGIFTVMYDTSLFKDYFKMFVSWIIATVFSGVIIAVLTYKVTFSGWGAFAFFVVVSVLIPNIVFLLLMHKTEEFKLSISTKPLYSQLQTL